MTTIMILGFILGISLPQYNILCHRFICWVSVSSRHTGYYWPSPSICPKSMMFISSSSASGRLGSGLLAVWLSTVVVVFCHVLLCVVTIPQKALPPRIYHKYTPICCILCLWAFALQNMYTAVISADDDGDRRLSLSNHHQGVVYSNS